MSLGLCVFVAWTIFQEFYKGSRAIRARAGSNWLMSGVELVHRNTRRYGGYIVHMGIVFMFIGFSGAAFNKSATVEVKVGDRFMLGQYELRVADVNSGENLNYAWSSAEVEVFRGGGKIDTLYPEKRFFQSSRQGTSEVALRRRLNEDLYLNFAGMSSDNQKAVIQAYVFPLVSWIWIGFWVLLVGTAICLVPNKTRLEYARTEVVGVVKGHVPVR
jgi:cytochrome c-type biogenesis protein CcmF